ncbi:hypothetical protein [Echinicola pacifica]|uniref:hypothetical protein n=1 Tax=Echinicola pacifica TaxID=346377 RepID=UPI001E2AD0B2|nr:hypothetical protein [Echinicola pacifica]
MLVFFLTSEINAQNFYKERIPRPYTVSLYGGPASMYTDNGGPYRDLNFPIFGSFALAGEKKITSRVNFRATLGYQHVSSNKEYNANQAFQWGEDNKAYAFQGDAFYIDFSPVFYFIPYPSHVMRPRVNGYAGIGLGYLVLPGQQAFATKDPNGDPKLSVIDITNSTIYLPIRLGGSMAFGSNWDIGFEGSLFASFSDELDGNAGTNQTNDLFMQANFFVKHYISPFPFWKK